MTRKKAKVFFSEVVFSLVYEKAKKQAFSKKHQLHLVQKNSRSKILFLSIIEHIFMLIKRAPSNFLFSK